MKYIDLDNKTIDELHHLLAEAKNLMLRMQFDLANKKLRDVSKIKKTKIDIARLLAKMKTIKQ